MIADIILGAVFASLIGLCARGAAVRWALGQRGPAAVRAATVVIATIGLIRIVFP